MTNIIIDFETRSRCDLAERGGDNYALDISTEILCLAACYEDAEDTRAWLWYPHHGALPPALTEAVLAADLVMAHNAAFDRDIWEIGVQNHGFPDVAFNKWYCTSAQARVNAMPSSLDNLTQALDTKHKKNYRGSQLIRLLSIPDSKTGDFREDPQLLKEMGAYCLDDVKATKSATNALRPMTQVEHKDWLVNERINQRGIKIDGEMAYAATFYAEAETEDIARRLTAATHGGVTKHTQHQRLKGWVLLRVCDEGKKLMAREVDGVTKYSLDKSTRTALLDAEITGKIWLNHGVRDVIELAQAGSKSSVAKFSRMLTRADDVDGRCRGAFVYAGASQTLRFASRGLQLHNMTRNCCSAEETEKLKAQMLSDKTLVDDEGKPLPVMETLSKLLRPALIPEKGKVFVVGDWSSVEARALPWLSKSSKAKTKLDLFRSGKDVYVEAAEAMGIDDRQIGKVAELSLGFGGGAGAFSSMAKNYGLHLPDEEVDEIIRAWRDTNAWAVSFWTRLNDAAMSAVRVPGETFRAGHVAYKFDSNLMGGTLLCVMPGGLVLQYPKAEINIEPTDYGMRPILSALKANWTPAQGETDWPRVGLWKGLLAENVTQAFCARLLRNVLVDCPDVVAHVHDEIVMEVPKAQSEAAMENLRTLMTTVPKWAKGLPLAAEPVTMERYGK